LCYFLEGKAKWVSFSRYATEALKIVKFSYGIIHEAAF